MKKQNKGVTLIALVITIIVLMILAGVSIATLLGDDGILTKAKEVKEATTIGAIEEAIVLYNVNKEKEGLFNNPSSTKTFAEDLVDKGIIKDAADVTVDADGNIIYNGQTVGTLNPDSGNTGDEGTTKPDGTWNGTVNTPTIEKGMIPIKYDEAKVKWVVCSAKNENNEWYDYENQKWANIMLSDKPLTKGTEIAYDDLESMFVWIPRYAYRITSDYHNSDNDLDSGNIDIKFLEGKSKTRDDITMANATGKGNWNIPPAFTYGTDEISGFYVAKFEVIKNTETNKLQVKPGVSSLENIRISDAFNVCKSMDPDKNSHMLKNSEWGATAYLAHSKYGRNGTEVTINNSSSCYTGGGKEEAYKTNTAQSTTGNITGIYDMSGGAFEYVAAYVANGNGNLTYSSLYTELEAKYKDVYVPGRAEGQQSNYEANAGKYGDAVYETSSSYTGANSWNGDYSDFPYSSDPFFLRGGIYYGGSNAGLFSFDYDNGDGLGLCSFRLAFLFDT